MRPLVYSAISSGYDSIKPGRDLWFFDSKEPLDSGDQCRGAKWPKVMLHRIMGVEYSLWLDGSVRLNPGVNIDALFGEYLSHHDIAVMKHPLRECLYDEAAEVLGLGLEPDPQRLFQQVRRYRAAGMPSMWGLAETGVMFRRHTKVINQLCEAWWTEIEQGSRRDQISFPYALRSTGTAVRLIEGRPFFTVEPHSAKDIPAIKRSTGVKQSLPAMRTSTKARRIW